MPDSGKQDRGLSPQGNEHRSGELAWDPQTGVADEPLDRGGRVIATSRLVLSVAALAIALLNPRQSVYGAPALYLVLTAYIAYSAMLLWRRSRQRRRKPTRAALLADVAWFTVIVGLSEGATSPFFLFFLFAVCSAAMRWGMRTTVGIAGLSAGLYLGSVMVTRHLTMSTLHTAQIMRPVYLVLLGYLVGFIGEHELSAKRRLIEIIAMQREFGRSHSQLFMLAWLLRRVARFFKGDYVLLQLRTPDGDTIEWEGKREPGRRLVIHSLSPASWSAHTGGRQSYRVSHVLGSWGRRAECYTDLYARPQRLADQEEPGFLARSRTRSLVSVPILSPGGVRGRLLVGRSRENFSKEDLDFCHTLVSQGTILLDNLILEEKTEELAVAEERARIARDVHDGFVQSLASIDVGIEVCRRLERKDPKRLATELGDLQQIVKRGYQEARRYLDRLRQRSAKGPDVAAALRDLVEEFQTRSDLEIDLHASLNGIAARHGIGFEILQIVREGLTNIIRHARACSAEVSVERNEQGFLVVIRDDGRGFPAPALGPDGELADGAAPWSIRERVEALGGRLRIKSSVGGGSEIRITLLRTTL